MKQTYNQPLATWIVLPAQVKLEIRDKETNELIIDSTWDKDTFWKQIFEFKQYCEDRGDIINGES